ncbi:TRAP transporter small permease [Aidingimonas lacisalsi]|uniref:TRAP transporter small permease n=1 Tax=Aidingimonas lacisalsi TaxID=2604086 RepID=UPI0011D1807D|nr:TRAP transporter small permease [Aidingimonas lacisalsi]
MRTGKRLLEIFCLALLAGMIFVPFLQVITRSVFGFSIPGSGELTRFLLICLVFSSYPLAISSGENIEMAELRETLPSKLKIALYKVIALLSILACLFIAYAAFITVLANLNKATPVLKIPYWIFFSTTFLGFAGAAFMHFRQGLRSRHPKHSIGI